MNTHLKTLEKCGVVGWSQDPEFPQSFAAGCFDQAAESGYLKIYTLNISDPNNPFVLQNEVEFEERFNCISWGAGGDKISTNGLIAGGMSDGSLMLWDAYTLLNEKEQDGLLCNMGLYEPGEFFSLEFNNFKKEWLATGGAEVCILNLENIESPEIFTPTTDDVGDSSLITSVSWNKHQNFPHILATGSSNGVVNVWDLRVKKSIFSFSSKKFVDEGDKNIQVNWNPSVPTQLAVTFDCDKEVALQVWDLREKKTPIYQFKEFHKGAAVHSLSWSSIEKSKILTGDRAGAICVWDIDNVEISHSETLESEFLVASWVPQLPSMFYTISTEGDLHLKTTDQEQLEKITQSHAPKWMKNPIAGSSIGNTFLSYSQETGAISSSEAVVVDKLSQDINIWAKLEPMVERLCHHYINSSKGDERSLWEILNNINDESSEIIAALGFDKDEVIKKTEAYTGKTHQSARKRDSLNGRAFNIAALDDTQAEDLFNQLSSQAEANPNNNEGDVEGSAYFFNNEVQNVEEIVVKNENWDAGAEDLIKKNLFVGNFSGALDAAVKCGRYAHAFLIALSRKDDAGLLRLASESFSVLFEDPVFNILQSLMNDNIDDLIENYELMRWRELTAFIISNFPEDYKTYLKRLTIRLLENGMISSAQCLSLLARDFDTFTNTIIHLIQKAEGEGIFAIYVDLFRKLAVLKVQTGYGCENSDVQSALIKLAYYLTEQGHCRLAYSLLSLLGDSGNSNQVLIAMNTIYFLNQAQLYLAFQPPANIVGIMEIPRNGRRMTAKKVIDQAQTNTNKNRRFGPSQSTVQNDDGQQSVSDFNEEPKKFAGKHYGRKPAPKPVHITNTVQGVAQSQQSINKQAPKPVRVNRPNPAVPQKKPPSQVGPRQPQAPVPRVAAMHHPAPPPVHHAAPPPVHHAAPPPVHHAAPPPVHHHPVAAPPPPVHHAAPPPVHHHPVAPPPVHHHPVAAPPVHHPHPVPPPPVHHPAPAPVPGRGRPVPPSPGPIGQSRAPPAPVRAPNAAHAHATNAPPPPRHVGSNADAMKTHALNSRKVEAPPRRTWDKQEVEEEEEIDVDTLLENIENCKVFLKDFVEEDSKFAQYERYLDELVQKIEKGLIRNGVVEHLSEYFENLREQQVVEARASYKEMKKLCDSSDKNWLNVLLQVLSNF